MTIIAIIAAVVTGLLARYLVNVLADVDWYDLRLWVGRGGIK